MIHTKAFAKSQKIHPTCISWLTDPKTILFYDQYVFSRQMLINLQCIAFSDTLQKRVNNEIGQ